VSRRAWVEQIMGMPISIHLRGPGAESEVADAAVADAFELLREADRLFSPYLADSDVSRIRGGELELASADPLVGQVVALCSQASEVTAGAFTDQLPDRGGVLRFDPSGLVKGWAGQRAAQLLTDLPAAEFCLNAGGDIAVGGGTPWRVGVEDPTDRTRVAHVVELTRGAVATSGTAARGAHLYDPATGAFVNRPGSVTVVGPSLLWADVWATALFVGPAALRARFADVAGDYRAIYQ